MIVEYGARGIPSKIALDRDGVIVYKPRAGAKPEVEWRELFEELAAGAAS